MSSTPTSTRARGERALPARHLRGRIAEAAAIDHVTRLGMRLIGQNVRVGRLELDIVAQDGRSIAVIEVRTRGSGSWQTACDSVGWIKQRRLRRAAALLWATRFSKWRTIDRMRFDVAAVNLDEPGRPVVDYYRAAFV